MPAQRPPRLPELQRLPRHLPINPKPVKQAAGLSERSSDDSEDFNSMELDGPEEDEPEDSVHGSRVEPERPIDDSDLRRIDRECFDQLSEWLSAVSLTRSVWNDCSFGEPAKCSGIESAAQVPRRTSAWWVRGVFEIPVLDVSLDTRYRDAFGLRPDLVNNGVPRDEVDRILYNRKIFLGINKVLDNYLDIPLSQGTALGL